MKKTDKLYNHCKNDLETIYAYIADGIKMRSCTAPFVEHLPNKKKIYYKVTKEKDQMMLSHIVLFLLYRGLDSNILNDILEKIKK